MLTDYRPRGQPSTRDDGTDRRKTDATNHERHRTQLTGLPTVREGILPKPSPLRSRTPRMLLGW